MASAKPRLTGAAVGTFLRGLGLVRLDPIGRTSASGEDVDDATLNALLEKGDPVPPSRGRLAEDPDTIRRLLHTAGPGAFLPLTPDGHLASHQPVLFDRGILELPGVGSQGGLGRSPRRAVAVPAAARTP